MLWNLLEEIHRVVWKHFPTQLLLAILWENRSCGWVRPVELMLLQAPNQLVLEGFLVAIEQTDSVDILLRNPRSLMKEIQL